MLRRNVDNYSLIDMAYHSKRLELKSSPLTSPQSRTGSGCLKKRMLKILAPKRVLLTVQGEIS